MPTTSFALSPTQKQQQLQKQNLQRTQNLQKQGWGEFGEQQDNNSALSNTQQEFNNWNTFLRVPEPQDIKIEFPLTVKAEPDKAVETLQIQEKFQEDRINYDIADVLEAEQTLNQSHEFSSSGSMPINAETLAVAEAQREISEYRELRQEQAAIVKEVENILQENMLENQPSVQAKTITIPNIEPLIKDNHTEQPQEFKQNSIDLLRHHSDVDFLYFFGWLGGQIEPATKFLSQTVLNAKHWIDTKSAVIDDLFIKQILGFGGKKEISKEEQDQQQTRATNKRAFFDSLRAGMARVISPERQRNLRSRIETLNKSLKRGNLSYEGDLDQNGQIRENSLMEEELANSKKSEEQLLAEKKKKMMMAGKGKAKSGPGITMSADKSHNFNNAAKLAG